MTIVNSLLCLGSCLRSLIFTIFTKILAPLFKHCPAYDVTLFIPLTHNNNTSPRVFEIQNHRGDIQAGLIFLQKLSIQPQLIKGFFLWTLKCVKSAADSIQPVGAENRDSSLNSRLNSALNLQKRYQKQEGEENRLSKQEEAAAEEKEEASIKKFIISTFGPRN